MSTPAPIFNYDLQVWIVGPDHRVKPCSHPERMRKAPANDPQPWRAVPCCNAWRWAGLTEADAITEYAREAIR
jgi:hypothetical protein